MTMANQLTDTPLIDAHMHVGRLYATEAKALTPRFLLDFMDRSGIERAALMPIESPEECHYYVTTREVLAVCRRHDGRFIPFCNVDPRIGDGDNTAALRARLSEHKRAGCKGYGEAMTGLAIDDIRLQRVYGICGELELPVLFHMDGLRNLDGRGLPGLERMLQAYPRTVFIGHAQHFWAEISGDATESQFSTYPTGPVAPGGAVVRLLADYPNLHADLSAGSGLNAMTRDRAFALRFVERFQDKLLFGTDLCRRVREVGNVAWLRGAAASGEIAPQAFRKVARDNIIRILQLGQRAGS
jgi:predicted TIM-barrel fold metal-dependent hydrolase